MPTACLKIFAVQLMHTFMPNMIHKPWMVSNTEHASIQNQSFLCYPPLKAVSWLLTNRTFIHLDKCLPILLLEQKKKSAYNGKPGSKFGFCLCTFCQLCCSYYQLQIYCEHIWHFKVFISHHKIWFCFRSHL